MSPLEKNLSDGQKWEFDQEVADSFDDMLARSIPQHDVMRRLVTDLARRKARTGAAVVDLGAARGEAVAGLLDRTGGEFHLIEKSHPMAAAIRKRYGDRVDVWEEDLRDFYPPVKAGVTLSVLTLQFVPIEHRQKVLKRVFDATVAGGAFLLVEKIIGETAEIDEILVDAHHAIKREAGYSDEEIRRKRLSLEGVLVPVTAAFNEYLLRGAGSSEIGCFWRCLNFAGWIAIKNG